MRLIRSGVSINMIVSRSRESRADRIAVKNYGRKVHVAVLKKATAMAPHFEESMARIKWRNNSNFFGAFASLFVGEQHEQEKYLKEAMERDESEFRRAWWAL